MMLGQFIASDTSSGPSSTPVVSSPGAEGAQPIQVQYDLDWDRFIRLFVERVTRE